MTQKFKNCGNPSRILVVLVSVAIVGCGGSKTQSVPETVQSVEESVEESVDTVEHVEEKVEGVAESVAEPKAEPKAEPDVEGETIQDEPMIAGLTREDFPQSEFDAFKGMDQLPGNQAIELSKKGVMGRNDWVAWNAGNQRMWDYVATTSFGMVDMLKVADSSIRQDRFDIMGLINEPGMASLDKVEGETANPYGVRLDVPKHEAKRNELYDENYGLYRTEGLDPEVYGYSSGVMGIRLFPNPAFFEGEDAAQNQADWDADKYYNDPIYFESSKLIRPYRPGTTCGICHVAFNPIYPPDNPAEPAWTNLSSAIGNQFIREGSAFGHNVDLQEDHESNFFWQVLNSQFAGTSDTSRVASDHINAPTAINGIFRLGERLRIGVKETMGEGGKRIPPAVGEDGQRAVPHILRDGADSIGAPGATIRVYINVGLFSEYFLTRHNAGVGLTPQKPFEIAFAQKNSVYWQATEARLENVAYFLTQNRPMQLKYATLKDGGSGQEYIDSLPGDLARGKLVFAEECARCHSSKRPPVDIDQESEDSLESRAWFAEAVKSDAFWKDNFLSEDRRHALTEDGLGTNASRAVGTNAMRGHIWDNFSSETYKELPAVGELIGGWPDEPVKFTPQGGGPGYYRPPSLVAIWTSAPYLSFNALGKQSMDPSVEGRLEAFHDGMEKMLGLKPRDNIVWRTKGETYFVVPGAFFPKELRLLVRDIVEDEDGKTPQIRFGPIPDGTTINLLMNLDFTTGNFPEIAKLLITLKRELHATKDMEPDQRREHIERTLKPILLKNNLCPDFVMDKGHTYAGDLSEDDKRSLIKLLVTL